MPHKTFVISVRDPEVAEDQLNAFLRSHRVLAVDRKWVDQGANSFWAVWVDYLETTDQPSPSAAKKRVDYKELLSPEDFAVFAQLRSLRKEMAAEDGVALFNVFNNEQLAQIAENRVRTLDGLLRIPGIGEARVKKYGARVLGLVNEMWKVADEASPESPGKDN